MFHRLPTVAHRWLPFAALALLPALAQAQEGWFKTVEGCLIRNPSPKPNESAEWSGPCPEGRAEGRGTLRWIVDGETSSTYVGDVKAGEYSGQGRSEYKDGETYEGGYLANQRSGQGTLKTAKGIRYVGEFLSGRFQGKGLWQNAEGLAYEGLFLAGRRHGHGVMRWPNGDTFTGQWQDGQPRGDADLILSNGHRCTGKFERGQWNGLGKCRWANGDTYDGSFLYGTAQGMGVYVFSDGRRYEGNFRAGRPSGSGTLTTPQGLNYRGWFTEGIPTQAEGASPPPGQGLDPADTQKRLESLAYTYSDAIAAPPPIGRRSVGMVCTQMGRPSMPALPASSAVHGETLFKVIGTVREGRVVAIEVIFLRKIEDKATSMAFVKSIETLIRDTYVCPGDHVFEQEFQFKY